MGFPRGLPFVYELLQLALGRDRIREIKGGSRAKDPPTEENGEDSNQHKGSSWAAGNTLMMNFSMNFGNQEFQVRLGVLMTVMFHRLESLGFPGGNHSFPVMEELPFMSCDPRATARVQRSAGIRNYSGGNPRVSAESG